MIKSFLSTLFIAGLATNSLMAQTCGTDDVFNKLKHDNRAIEELDQQLEQSIKEGMKVIDFKKFAKTTADTTTYDIPIVIHVIHDYGAENLSDNAIIAAVKNWIDVYQARNADTADVITPFKKYVGNPRMRLHLATKDPNGNPTKGITRHQSYLTINGGDEAKLDGWPNNQYVNFWFINTFSGAHTGAAAYAYYPASGAQMPYYDGVIGLASYINTDKALPHELGHVLNLQHTWGNTNNPDVACGDDQVDDTPPTKGHLTVGCVPSALYDGTCAGNYFVNYTVNNVTTTVDYPDTTNAQNIMDYTYCQKMFTIRQCDRMRLALTSTVAGRNNLITAANLAATGALAPTPDLPPVADFFVGKATYSNGFPATTERCYFLPQGCPLDFTFTNSSWNDTVTGVQWTFSNGATNPTSTSAATLHNRFSQAGWVTIGLTATGNNSGSNTFTNTQAVYIADSVMESGNYRQDFSNPGMNSKWPLFNYYNNNFKWEIYNGTNAGLGDNSSLRYHSYDTRTSPANKTGTADGDFDDAFTPGFNLTNYPGNVNLNFYTAGAASASSSPDTMEVYVSSDLCRTWTLLSTLAGSNLSNNGIVSGDFVPTSASQWKAQTIAIPAANRAAKTFFKFRYHPGDKGNNLYMDNFAVSQFTTEVNEVTRTPGAIKLYPNPTTKGCKIAFTTGNDGNVSYVIKDITGKTVYAQQAVYGANTLVEQDIPASTFQARGFYLVTVTIADKTITQKLIVE